MSKYDPLKNKLSLLNHDTIKLTFSQIESILGFQLPVSAYTHNEWWANRGHYHAKAWNDAGYETKGVDIHEKTVQFQRKGSPSKTVETKNTLKQKANNHIIKESITPNKNKLEVYGYQFSFVQSIIPEKDSQGCIRKYYPQEKYDNQNGLPLHQYGEGAFCRFSIKTESKPGVYLWVVNDEIIYIGETVGFKGRFNTGYGNISPRNCYIGGQPTNCKMNKVVLNLWEQNKTISLFFMETVDYKRVELELLNKIKTTYNSKNN